jgi:hypothetical protein
MHSVDGHLEFREQLRRVQLRYTNPKWPARDARRINERRMKSVQSNGHFQLQIPDFSKDCLTNEMQDASLRVLVLGHQRRTTEEEVVAPEHMRHKQLGLKILPSYDPSTAMQQP